MHLSSLFANCNYTASQTLKMLGCLNPTLSQTWTNPNVWLKI